MGIIICLKVSLTIGRQWAVENFDRELIPYWRCCLSEALTSSYGGNCRLWKQVFVHFRSHPFSSVHFCCEPSLRVCFVASRNSSSFSAPGERAEWGVGGQSSAWSWPQLLAGEGEIQCEPIRQHDHPGHLPTRSAWQRRQHFLYAHPVPHSFMTVIGSDA